MWTPEDWSRYREDAMEACADIALRVGEDLGNDEISINVKAVRDRGGILAGLPEWCMEKARQFAMVTHDREWDGEYYNEIECYVRRCLIEDGMMKGPTT